jgi:hypothetical protein
VLGLGLIFNFDGSILLPPTSSTVAPTELTVTAWADVDDNDEDPLHNLCPPPHQLHSLQRKTTLSLRVTLSLRPWCFSDLGLE